jgi:hypothetical protein
VGGGGAVVSIAIHDDAAARRLGSKARAIINDADKNERSELAMEK